jgi:hypothetical protein
MDFGFEVGRQSEAKAVEEDSGGGACGGADGLAPAVVVAP